jgi:hypothetical protein
MAAHLQPLFENLKPRDVLLKGLYSGAKLGIFLTPISIFFKGRMRPF